MVKGPQQMHETSTGERVPAPAIAGLIQDCLGKTGMPAADAAKVAELMTEADLTGADAHGVFRLPQYVRRLRKGGVNPRPDIRVQQSAAATAIVDGDNGMGHLVMARAAETAIELARNCGLAWVGARHSNHAGAAGVYAAMPLAHDMVGIYSVVASANHMAVWGGAETLLGTNPVAFAIPAGEEPPVVLDIATTVVSYGTVKNYRLQGKSMPEGWMVSTRDGGALTDPNRSAEGVLLPIGGYKGSGLALVLGLLAGTLNGAAFGATCSISTRSRTKPATPAISSSRSTCRGSRRSTSSRPRSTATCAISPPARSCRASMPSACPAPTARAAAPSGCATASRCRRNWWRSSTSSQVN
jgi:L-2-hydroxycarboxylate dehydrogenase (NAD+)